MGKLSWKAGTKPSLDDIVRLIEISNTNAIVNVNLTIDLPLLSWIFVTVRMDNKAGILYCDANNRPIQNK